MPSNNVFHYSKIRTRKRSAKKSIKTGKKVESSSFWNQESTVLESGIRNQPHGIQNPRLSWIPLHGAISMHLITDSAFVLLRKATSGHLE